MRGGSRRARECCGSATVGDGTELELGEGRVCVGEEIIILILLLKETISPQDRFDYEVLHFLKGKR